MDYWHKAWTCPFFKWDDQKSVGCEGGKLRFPDKESAVQYMDAYCASPTSWKKCTVAAALLKYYDRKEENDHE